MHWPPAPTSKKGAKQLQNLGQDQTNANPSMEPHKVFGLRFAKAVVRFDVAAPEPWPRSDQRKPFHGTSQILRAPFRESRGEI